MLQLNFPQYTFKFREAAHSLEIFCTSRKKWVALTPEEWVRQHVIAHLASYGQFSLGLIAAEYSWKSIGGRGRSDVVVFNNNGKVMGIVECKAPQVSLNNDNGQQLMAYQHFGNPLWVILTNGNHHLFWDIQNQMPLSDWPKAMN